MELRTARGAIEVHQLIASALAALVSIDLIDPEQLGVHRVPSFVAAPAA
jgi:hypothetical protein